MVLRAGALEVTGVADAAVECESTFEDDDEKDPRVDDDAVVAGALAVRVMTSVLTTVAVEVVTETDSDTVVVADIWLVAETLAKIEDSDADWVDRGSSGESDDEKAAEEGDADCESVDAERLAAVEDAKDIDDVVAVLEAALAELELAETKVDAMLEADE